MIEFVIPLMLLAVSAAALHRKLDVFALLTEGAQDGVRLLASVAPTLIILMTSVTMLQRSGFFSLAAPVLAPACHLLGLPEELAPLLLIRPVSASAALGVGAELMRVYGVDSRIGRTAAVMLACSETTFYAMSVYLGAAGVRRSRYIFPAALLADLTGYAMAGISVRLFFG